MTASYNLVDEPWIACALPGGGIRHHSLRDVFGRAHAIAGIAYASPMVEVAVFRLLLALVHRVMNGPRTDADWEVLVKRGSFDFERFDEYFSRWRDRFDLFHPERPFHQLGGFALLAPDGTVAPPDTPARLVMEQASGNNGTLFDHAVDGEPVRVPPAAAAAHLLAAQTWGLGGGKGPRSNLFGPHPYAAHAPMVGRLHVRVQRPTLFETLAMNASGMLMGGAVSTPEDRPVWEWDTPRPPATVRPEGLLDLLTFPARCVRLVPDDAGRFVTGVYVAPGLKVLDDDPSWPPSSDPAVATTRSDEGLRCVYLSESKAVWRDIGALLAIGGAGSQHDGRPAVVRHAARRGRHLLGAATVQPLTVVGLVNDKAKPILWTRDQLPVHVRLLEDQETVALVVEAVGLSETVAYAALRKALGVVAQNLLSKGSDRVGPLAQAMWAHGSYWSDLEQAFSCYLLGVANDAAAADTAWRADIRRAAEKHFVAATASIGQDARGLRASACGEAILRSSLFKLLSTEAG